MRRKLFDVTVLVGTPQVLFLPSADSAQLLVIPAATGTVLVERFNTVDGSNVPLDLQTVQNEAAAAMTAIASGAAVNTRTAVLAAPCVTGLKITATTASCRVVVNGQIIS